MPKITAPRRKYLSELLKGHSTYEETAGVDFNFHRVTVYAASDTPLATIGGVVVWNATTDQWNIAGNTSVIPTEATNLPDGSPVAVTVGPAAGIGAAPGSVTVGTAGTQVTVLFRGDATVLKQGLEYAAQGILTAKQAEIELALNKQKISVITQAEEVTPSFITV